MMMMMMISNTALVILNALIFEMQNWSTLLEQGCLDQFGGNTECDYIVTHDHILSSDFIDTSQKGDESMSSKKQLRYSFLQRVCPSVRLSVPLSVCLSSVTCWYCVETNEATITRFSPSGTTIILVSGEVMIVWKFTGDHPLRVS